jgi:hypothetical protein
MCRWKAKFIKTENNFMSPHSRTLRGVGYEPEARAGLNPEPGTNQFRSKDKVKLVIRNLMECRMSIDPPSAERIVEVASLHQIFQINIKIDSIP